MSKEDGKWKKIGSYTHLLSDIRKPIKYTLSENPLSMNLCYYFRYKNKSYRGSTGENNLDDSHTKIKEIIFEITHGRNKKSEKKKFIKFEDVVKQFLKFKKNQKLSHKTFHEYHRQSKYLLEYFKGRDVNSFQSKKEYMEYTNWRKTFYKTHKKRIIPTYKRNGKMLKGRKFDSVGDTTINKENRLLVSILRFSKEYMNALNGIEIQSYTMIKADNKKRDVVKYGEYKKLEKYWKEKNPYYWKIISFVDKTGIRYPSEMENILVKDVNLKEGSVMIRNRKSRGEPVNTKIPLVTETKIILEELLSRDEIPKAQDDPVFVNDKGIQIKYINQAFKKSLFELGINQNLSMYSFRHTFATRMIKNPDIPMKITSYILGHADTTMVDRIYSHLGENDALRIFQRIEEKKNRQKKEK